MKGMETDPVRELIPDQAVVSVRADATVLEAVQAMHENNVGAVIVTDDASRVVGIITERDLLSMVAASALDSGAGPARDIMTADPACCVPETPVHEAAELMMARRIRHLPIVSDAGVAVGMVSSRDVLGRQVVNDRALRSAAEQVAMLSTCLKSLDFEEVVSLVCRQVPLLFSADRTVLHFAPEDAAAAEPLLLKQSDCPCPPAALPCGRAGGRTDGEGEVLLAEPPQACRDSGAVGPCLIVPLNVAGIHGDASRADHCSGGALCMCGFETDEDGTPQQLRYKGELIREVLNATLTNAKLYQLARQESLTDPLTGVGSRRMFEEQLQAEWSRSQRYGRCLCLAILDVDHFKSINDQLGHVKGDEILRKFADCLTEQKRTSDILARYGGDEFVLMLPETDEQGACVLLERIRRKLQDLSVPGEMSFSVSCGIAEFSAGCKTPANQLVRCADVALYEAKRTGRNRVESWSRISTRLRTRQRIEEERIEGLQHQLAEVSVQSKEVFVQSIWGLIKALEARDEYTRSHSENVMRYSVGLAEVMGLEADDVDVIRRAAVIHDIGKIGVPDSILHKPEGLTEGERAIMQQHPIIAVRILTQMRFLERELPIVRHHHEWWNGAGYPDGLSGERIPLGARVLAVADAFDAITSDRLYRRARSVAVALRTLEEWSGSQFDPEVVAAMQQWVRQVRQALGDPEEQITPQHLLDSQAGYTIAA